MYEIVRTSDSVIVAQFRTRLQLAKEIPCFMDYGQLQSGQVVCRHNGHVLDFAAELTWYESELQRKYDRKCETHKQITIGQGVTHCPNQRVKVWVRK